MAGNVSKKSIEHAVNVVLRVPALFIIEAWYRTDPTKVDFSFPHLSLMGIDADSNASEAESDILVHFFYYGALLFVTVLLLLPVRRLITLYMYLTSAAVLFIAHHLSGAYVTSEAAAGGAPCLRRAVLHLIAQCVLASVVARLLEWPGPSRLVFLVFAAPIVARVISPHAPLPAVQAGAVAVAAAVVAVTAVQSATRSLADVRLDGVLPVVAAAVELVPYEMVVFWVGLFTVQLYRHVLTDESDSAYASAQTRSLLGDGWLLAVLSSVSASCCSPLAILGLSVTVAYASGRLTYATRAWLEGAGDVPVGSGWAEGGTVLLVGVQMGVLEASVLQRPLMVTILLAVSAAMLLQSLQEVTAPLMLSAARRRRRRCLVVAAVLVAAPATLAVGLVRTFAVELWVLALTASCVLTAAQAAGSLVLCGLTLAGETDRTDGWVVAACGVTRAAELLVSVAVAVCGVWWCVTDGGCGLLSGALLAMHIHANVYCRLRAHWGDARRRRAAGAGVTALAGATESQLRRLDDSCSVCLQPLTVHAVRTPCAHYFHATCLRRWLCVRDACPLCHRPVTTAAVRGGETEERRRDGEGAGGDGGEMEERAQDGNASGGGGSEMEQRHDVGDAGRADVSGNSRREGETLNVSERRGSVTDQRPHSTSGQRHVTEGQLQRATRWPRELQRPTLYEL